MPEAFFIIAGLTYGNMRISMFVAGGYSTKAPASRRSANEKAFRGKVRV